MASAVFFILVYVAEVLLWMVVPEIGVRRLARLGKQVEIGRGYIW